MEKETIYQRMETYCHISTALIAYMKMVMVSIELQANQRLEAALYEELPLIFIEKGGLKTTLQSRIEPDQSLLLFSFEGSFHSQIPETEVDDYNISTVSLSRSTLLGIPKKHQYNLYRFFPEFHLFMQGMHQAESERLLHLAFSISNHPSEQRFENLLRRYPNIFQLASSIDIASSIGVHSHTLSTLKKNHFDQQAKKRR